MRVREPTSFWRENVVAVVIRDLTIRQRRRPWKRRRKTDFASFWTFPRLSQLALLLKRRGFWLELKREERAQVRTEMAKFIALPFPFPSKLKIWSFHVAVVRWRQRNVQKKRDARAELMFCSLNLYFFDVPVAVVVVVSYVVDMFIHKNYLGQFLSTHFQKFQNF